MMKKRNNTIETENVFQNAIIKDVIRYSLALYGIEHVVDVAAYRNYVPESLIAIRDDLRSEYEHKLANGKINIENISKSK